MKFSEQKQNVGGTIGGNKSSICDDSSTDNQHKWVIPKNENSIKFFAKKRI